MTQAVAAGAIAVAVLNTGASPINGPGGGIWYSGGNIPGVFSVYAQATQTSGGAVATIASTLSVNASSAISVQLSGRNPALETDVLIADLEVRCFK